MAGPYEVPDIAGGFYRGFSGAMQDAQALRTARQLEALRKQQEARDAAEESRRVDAFRLKNEVDKLALRGQILGSVETPEDYGRVLSEIQRLGLPMGDLPEERRSTAWETFRAPPPVQENRVAPAWITQQWAPGGTPLLAPGAQEAPQLPRGPMVAPGIDPEDITGSVQRAAERGLPMVQQTKMQEGAANRTLRGAELESRNVKYQTQLELARQAAALQERIANSRDEAKKKELEIELSNLDIKRGQLAVDQRKAAAAEKSAESGQKITENQGKAILFGQELSASLNDFRSLLGKGFDPTKISGALSVSMAGAEGLASPFRAFAGRDAQLWNNASDQLAQVALRYESGAAIGEQEFGKKIRANIPRWNDPPELVKRKLEAIERARQAFEVISGRALPSAGVAGIPTVASQSDYDALPAGSRYRAPDGKVYTKKGGR